LHKFFDDFVGTRRAVSGKQTILPSDTKRNLRFLIRTAFVAAVSLPFVHIFKFAHL